MTEDEKEAILEKDFLTSSLKRAEFMRHNDAKRANKEYDRLHRLMKEMRQLPDRGEAALKRISANDDVEVQIDAAAALLAVDETYALKLLTRIAHSRAGLSSLTAEMTIKEWKKGALRDYLA